MIVIKTEEEYQTACERIEQLLKVVNNDTPTYDENFKELDALSNAVADYEGQLLPWETFKNETIMFEICPKCGKKALCDYGHRYFCEECRTIFDMEKNEAKPYECPYLFLSNTYGGYDYKCRYARCRTRMECEAVIFDYKRDGHLFVDKSVCPLTNPELRLMDTCPKCGSKEIEPMYARGLKEPFQFCPACNAVYDDKDGYLGKEMELLEADYFDKLRERKNNYKRTTTVSLLL